MKKLFIATIALVSISAASIAQSVPVNKVAASKTPVVNKAADSKAPTPVIINKSGQAAPADRSPATVAKTSSTTQSKQETKKPAVTGTGKNSGAGPLKKDGSPDKRFTANKHLKANGSPDKRFKENKKHG
ncbi:hypothetical protein [Flavihumibacter sp. CACIAM 22H1]|uniref:hypothetical protein n=1 Tax=Flavihumibacter sp. CACIAM 22H1 TaxID=1812911 RepID=UPI0007A86807|nr:hypothetical protein [Flavihumibacter sp. CACIAM 22H1]KYP15526.1 MAG: hypothetical protein A1D16_21410 [Flavihumibacter sp. CACIAM 22H1]